MNALLRIIALIIATKLMLSVGVWKWLICTIVVLVVIDSFNEGSVVNE